MPFDHLGLETIDETECRALLASATIGRIALSVRALPVVLPVNFALLEESILIRTGGGSKFDAACHEAVVAFEVDGFDALSHTGWSVLVQGQARVVQSPAELAEAHRARLTAWANPAADDYVKVSLDLITGRRLGEWYWGHGLPVAPSNPPR